MRREIQLLFIGLALLFSQGVLGQCMPGDLDSDLDGICDLLDKDDDNDGILDEMETVCTALLTDLSFYGTALDTIKEDTIFLHNTGVLRTSYSNELLSLPIHLEFQSNRNSNKMIGLLPSGANETTDTWNDEAYKLYMNQNGTFYGKLTNGWTFTMPGFDGKFFELDIDDSGKLTVSADGDIIFSGTAPVTDYRFAITGSNGGIIDAVQLTYKQSPCHTQDIDTDGDNIPNRLDLDSDGDLCVDAFEGSANFGLNDMDGAGRLLGGVDAFGVPMAASTQGQGTGESLIAHSPLIDFRACMCISSNNPTDTDNDGVCDAIDICANVPNNLIGTSCNDGDNTTINDVWTSGCECIGTPTCTAGALDSDNDGVCDIEDLDDDNDGIIDKKETTYSGILLPDLNMIGDAIDSIQTNRMILSAVGGWRTSYSTEIFSLPIHLEFRSGIGSSNKMIGFLPLGYVERPTGHDDAAYKLYIHIIGRLYGKLPNQWTLNVAGGEHQFIEMDIDINGNLSVKKEGIEVYTGTAPVSDYRLAVTSLNGGSFEDLVITHGQIPCTVQDIDSDGDGTPNRLDLDSDNDNCVDAFEGDADFGLNDMDNDGRLTGGIDADPQSPAYGVPSVLDEFGQGVGISRIAQSPDSDSRECLCIASNNPTDSDNDGICDDADTCPILADNLIGTPCNDGDNATVNDLWTSSCECLGSIPCSPGELDSDADGICDIQDKDDDNDGIPDEVESICSIPLSNVSFYGNSLDYIDADSIILLNTTAWRSSYSNDTFSLPIHLEFRADIDQFKMIGFLPLGFVENVNAYSDGAYKLYINATGLFLGKLPTAWVFNSSIETGQLIEMDIDINGKLTVRQSGAEIYSGNAPIADYKLAVSGRYGSSFNGVAITHGNVPCITTDIDYDGDGMPNRLDLDSDNDLCVDAFEGTADLGLNDMDGDGRLLGGIDSNPTSPAYGIPLVAGSGQESGQSNSADFPSVESRECICIASNNPTDTDGDGVCDAIDFCDGIDDTLIGTPCNDGDDCTINDIWKSDCACEGVFWDTDGDTECDINDVCAGFDDNIDIDDDGIPFCIDNCVDVDEDDICDDVDPNVQIDNLEIYFSICRGIYDTAFNLSLHSNDPNATINYTLDSEWPSTTFGDVYATPINVSGTTVVKAIAYNATDTTKIETHSYIFLDDVLSQPADLSIYPPDTEMDSLVVNNPQYNTVIKDGLREIVTTIVTLPEEHFIDPDTGIYANPHDRGRAWERMGSIEFLFSDGTHIQENMGVRIHGGASRNRDKKAFRVFFREDYGVKKLDYPLFGDDAADETDAIVLRCRGGQSWVSSNSQHRDRGQLSRDQVARDLQGAMGQPNIRGFQSNLYINGVYWGQYNIIEYPNQEFMETYLGGDSEEYDIFNHSGLEEGDSTAWVSLHEYADTAVTSAVVYDSISSIVDLENLADYVLLNFFAGNNDWDTNNWYASRRNATGGKWHFFNWDCEQYFKEEDLDVTTKNNWLQPTGLFNALMEYPDFRQLFYDKLHCNTENDGVLTPQFLDSMWMRQYELLGKSIIPESARWGDNQRPGNAYTLYNEFLLEQNRLRTSYFPGRESIFKAQLIASGHWDTLVTPVTYNSFGTVVNSGFQLTLTNPNSSGTIYYTTDGTDPRAPGGSIAPGALVYNSPITINEITEVRARVLINTNWSANCPQVYFVDQDYSGIVINEIHYNQDTTRCGTDSLDVEFLEITNTGNQTIDLFSCTVSEGVNFRFPYRTLLAPNEFIVLAENPVEFSLAFGGIEAFGKYAGALDNGGETLKILDPFGNTIDSLTYNDRNPWDEDPDDNGPSLELLHPQMDNADPLNWFRSDDNCGTPGVANSRVCAGVATPIVINEINYNSDNNVSDPGDWIELYNPNNTTVNLSGWTFYDNNNEFVLPSGIFLDANEYLVLVENEVMFSNVFPNVPAVNKLGDFSFGLSNKGERISLFNPDKCLSDYVVYNDRFPWDTIPDGNGPTLSLITPGSDNSLPQSWEASSNINAPLGTPGRANEPCPGYSMTVPGTICEGDTVLIHTSSSDAITFNWTIAGGTPASAIGDSIYTVFHNPGLAIVELQFDYYECSDTEQQLLTVATCNSAPNTQADAFSVNEDNVLNGNVLLNDSEPEGQPISTTLNVGASFGTVTLNNNGSFSYLPNSNFFGTDQFTYEACDDSSPALCAQESVVISVVSVNDRPIVNNDTLSTNEGVQVAGDAGTNDFDVETNPMSYQLVTFTQNGSILFNFNGSFYYTSFVGFSGIDSFQYHACDNGSPQYCDTATVYIEVIPDCVTMDISLFLEGAYNSQTGQMTTTLNTTRALLPGMVGNPVSGQPYNNPPWNYYGTEGAGWAGSDYESTIVDWILISLRTDITKSTEVHQFAGLLHSDGSVTFPGECRTTSELPDAYYIVAEHRNHMAVMSPVKVNVLNRTLSWDFRLADGYTFGGSGAKELSAGVWGLFAGDCNQIDDPVSYDISGNDKSAWLTNNGKFGVYLTTDMNMNGDVNGSDKALWILNNGVFGSVRK